MQKEKKTCSNWTVIKEKYILLNLEPLHVCNTKCYTILLNKIFEEQSRIKQLNWGIVLGLVSIILWLYHQFIIDNI